MNNTINPLLCTDVYKMSHMETYPKGITKVYSYLVARDGKTLPQVLFFGLQYYLKQYLTIKPERWMVEEYLDCRKSIVGTPLASDLVEKLYGLVDLGYFPLEIKAVPEGTVLPVKNVLMTITNTHPDYPWLVGFFESLLLKVWNTCTVASYDLTLKQLVKTYAHLTCDNEDHVPFQVHDFGYRGCSSEETSGLSGAGHLVNFLGTDTVPAVHLVNKFYGGSSGPVGLSVPATEHSVMCAYGPENELEAFKSVLKTYPTGIVSIVSDTYNLWNVLTNFVDVLKEDILARDGKVVFRPDSGEPIDIICGDMNADPNSPEGKGALRLLAEKFGTTTNSLGFKVLNPKVGLIYGDGMYFDRFSSILCRMAEMGFASSNLVVGIGGLLLQQHNRDEQGFAIKATYAEVDGEDRELFKDPITDPGKKSLRGLLKLTVDEKGTFETKDQCTWEEEKTGILKTVFKNGVITWETTLDDIRTRAKYSLI